MYPPVWQLPAIALRRLPFLPHRAGYAMEKKSTIIAIGLTVHNTPVEIREKLAVPEAEWPRAIAELTSFPHIEEAGVLSTCNRMELYVVALSQRRGTREVRRTLAVPWCHGMLGQAPSSFRPAPRPQAAAKWLHAVLRRAISPLQV